MKDISLTDVHHRLRERVFDHISEVKEHFEQRRLSQALEAAEKLTESMKAIVWLITPSENQRRR